MLQATTVLSRSKKAPTRDIRSHFSRYAWSIRGSFASSRRFFADLLRTCPAPERGPPGAGIPSTGPSTGLSAVLAGMAPKAAGLGQFDDSELAG